jgi:hypothetical protein
MFNGRWMPLWPERQCQALRGGLWGSLQQHKQRQTTRQSRVSLPPRGHEGPIPETTPRYRAGGVRVRCAGSLPAPTPRHRRLKCASVARCVLAWVRRGSTTDGDARRGHCFDPHARTTRCGAPGGTIHPAAQSAPSSVLSRSFGVRRTRCSVVRDPSRRGPPSRCGLTRCAVWRHASPSRIGLP